MAGTPQHGQGARRLLPIAVLRRQLRRSEGANHDVLLWKAGLGRDCLPQPRQFCRQGGNIDPGASTVFDELSVEPTFTRELFPDTLIV